MITFESTAVVLVIVAVVTIPAAIMLARYQARRTVWEQEIRESEEAAELSRRRLVAFVSHDLRTPLAGIRAVAEAKSSTTSSPRTASPPNVLASSCGPTSPPAPCG